MVFLLQLPIVKSKDLFFILNLFYCRWDLHVETFSWQKAECQLYYISISFDFQICRISYENIKYQIQSFSIGKVFLGNYVMFFPRILSCLNQYQKVVYLIFLLLRIFFHSNWENIISQIQRVYSSPKEILSKRIELQIYVCTGIGYKEWNLKFWMGNSDIFLRCFVFPIQNTCTRFS